MTPEELELIGVGYTIATGKLWSSFSSFHEQATAIMGRPVLNTDFRHEETWKELREKLERKIRDANA